MGSAVRRECGRRRRESGGTAAAWVGSLLPALALRHPGLCASPALKPSDAAEYGPILTEWVGAVAAAVHNRPSGRGLVGVRVFPSAEMNEAFGFDVESWIAAGYVDYIVPMLCALPLLLTP